MNDLDLARLKSEFWHLIGHRCHLREPGDFIKLRWLDEEVVAFNDHGDFLLFDNICPHRGARIFSESEGHQRLRCNYHGWSYQSGRFFAPFPMQIAEADLKRARFTTLAHQWCGDFLFAGVAPVQSLEEQLSGMWDIVARISHTIAAPYSTNEFTWESDWRIAVENALEQYHTAVGLVHQDSFNRYRTSEGRDEYFGRNSLYRCEYLDKRTERQLLRLGNLFEDAERHPGYESLYIFPFSMIGSTFGYSYALQTFFPADRQNMTYFTSRMMTSRLKPQANPAVLASFFASTDAMNRTIFDEDHSICKRVSPRSLAAQFSPIFAASEAKIAHFRKALQAVKSS